MAINEIEITQSNVVEGSNLLPIHSDLVFIADVTYEGQTPDIVHVEIRDINDTLLETYKAIPYKDLLSTLRQFVFVANEPIKSLMGLFDDFSQLNDTLLPVPDITKELKIRFVDPDTPAINDEVTIDFVHGAKQFGENPNLDDQFNNSLDTFFGEKDGIVYVYFYNDDAANDVAIDGQVLGLSPDEINVAVGGATEVVNVISDGTWLATESETWLELLTPGGTGDGSFSIVVDANGTGFSRSASVTVTQDAIIKTVTVNQGVSGITVTYDFSDSITEDINTAVRYRAWQLVDIQPSGARSGCAIKVNIDYFLNIFSAAKAWSRFYYGIGGDAVTEPTTWILIDEVVTPVTGGSGDVTDTVIIDVDTDEYLFVRMDLQLSGDVGDDADCNLDLVNGTISPCSGTVTASGSPLAWNKNINGGG